MLPQRSRPGHMVFDKITGSDMPLPNGEQMIRMAAVAVGLTSFALFWGPVAWWLLTRGNT